MIWIWITIFMITKEAEDDKISSDSEFQASVLSIVRVMIERRKVLESRSEQELQEYDLNSLMKRISCGRKWIDR